MKFLLSALVALAMAPAMFAQFVLPMTNGCANGRCGVPTQVYPVAYTVPSMMPSSASVAFTTGGAPTVSQSAPVREADMIADATQESVRQRLFPRLRQAVTHPVQTILKPVRAIFQGGLFRGRIRGCSTCG